MGVFALKRLVRLFAISFVCQVPLAAAQDSTNSGVIEGPMSYPSDYLPNDLTVCAERIAGGAEYCTDKKIKDKRSATGVGYKLSVPAGEYWVYATAFSVPAMKGEKAYYSEFVTCGLRNGCPSHKRIPVRVRAGETVTGVHPGDWYD
jgi:hypothetical protein